MSIGSLLYSSRCLQSNQDYSERLKFDLLPGMKKMKRKNLGEERYDEFIIDREKRLTETQEAIIQEELYLTQAKNDLFDNIATETIPPEKLPLILAFFAEYKKELLEDIGGVDQILENIDRESIPLNKVPTATSFLADYLQSAYKKAMFCGIKPHTDDMNFVKATNMNTHIYELDFSARLLKTLRKSDIKTIGELVKSYKDTPKYFLSCHNFGKKSVEELREFLGNHWFIPYARVPTREPID